MVEESLRGAIERCDKAHVRELLERVYDLHVLSVIDRERAWYLETGRLTASESQRIRPLVNELCGELRPHARLLVDAFGIPEGWLSAPMLDGPAPLPAAQATSEVSAAG